MDTKTEEENSLTELVPEPDKHLRLEYEKFKHLYEMNNDNLWNHLAFQKGGCLTGGQYVKNGRFGNEGCVMTNTKDWEIFFDRDKNQLSEFLIRKLTADNTKTRIHICPFFVATEGELAVYGLQKIYGLNWYDFEEFKDKQSRSESEQASLQIILQNKRKRETLINCWKNQVRR